MTAAHAFEYEVPEDDPRLRAIVDSTTSGNVVYLTRFGAHVAAVVPPERLAEAGPETVPNVREAIRRSARFTEAQKRTLLELVDALDNANQSVDQQWYWTPEWQAGEHEADVEIRAGHGRVLRSEAELLAALETAVDDPAALQ
jgi:hypothetical protein